ncbi:hypothetical protein ACX83H_16435 [Burkholderia pseudomallei]|uniref:hypothetical protein n=1 Tax=Burkholderia pseudomallei TaxID=28450 RepID=UPI000F20AE82|nr:hypothetical protein [Burkholderia pseudomallei]VBG97959.1 Uncharacterised protein [Burkholderia pseudomallei]
MIRDRDLIDHVQARIAKTFGPHVRLDALLVIGSLAYPQFARANSDVDLIAVRTGGETKDDSLHLEAADLHGQRRLIELRTFTTNGFYRHVMGCDIAQTYAFVRGYRFVLPTLDTERIVKLAIGRYFTDASRMWSEMRMVGLDAHLANVQFLMTDCKNQLLSPKVSDDPLLRTLRVAEVTKDFISQVWIALLMSKYGGTDEGCRTDVDSNSAVLQDVGLLRVFMGLRGGRMVDGDKYVKGSDVESLIQDVRDCSGRGVTTLVSGLENIFVHRFGRRLFLL